ncbi:hypothetical protein ACJMK2_038356 [Sinanodonta woodiana]|uniref:t-SNARE coiled-coil homology domain-containing protein n=1 Tax=Sinanodonta woodiana TaxID=1069815 RepID=A0ABD3W8Q9_SINWO
MELKERREFINRTKAAVKEMKSQMSNPTVKAKEETNVRQLLLSSNGPSSPYNRYTRLDEEAERSNQRFIEETQEQQTLVIKSQDEQLDLIGNSVGVLKNMSHQIGNELEDQNIMLDEFHHEIDTTDSRLDGVMKKMAKVLHMSNDCVTGWNIMLYVCSMLLKC